MGNHITIISWPNDISSAELVREFSDIRQRLGIGVDQYNEKPSDYAFNLCHVSGEVSSGFQNLYRDPKHLSDLWLSECRRFVAQHPEYKIRVDQLVAESIFLPM